MIMCFTHQKLQMALKSMCSFTCFVSEDKSIHHKYSYKQHTFDMLKDLTF